MTKTLIIAATIGFGAGCFAIGATAQRLAYPAQYRPDKLEIFIGYKPGELKPPYVAACVTTDDSK